MNGLVLRLMKGVNGAVIPLMPDWLFDTLASPYRAGSSIDEGLDAVAQGYEEYGRYATIDILGEAAVTTDDADSYLDAYMTIIDRLSKRGMNQHTVSVKPSAIAVCDTRSGELHISDDTSLDERLEKIVAHAKKNGISITLDMEDHLYNKTSIDVARNLWNKDYENLGIVLQSRLNVTTEQIADLGAKFPMCGLHVRACIGIYDEPSDIATRNKAVAKNRLLAHVIELLDNGFYAEVATHDHGVIRRILRDAVDGRGIGPEHMEFQFLKGVQNAYAIERELMDRGFKVRYYMPIELNVGDGMPYMRRRLMANPGMVMSGAKNVIQRMLGYGKSK